MSVVLPVAPDGARERGIFVALGIIKNGEPFIVVNAKGLDGDVGFAGAGTIVADGTARKVEPPITVMLPDSPGGARERGMFVAPGMTKKGEPLRVVVANVPGKGFEGGTGTVVACGTTSMGTPLMIDVVPLNPGGASDRGIVV